MAACAAIPLASHGRLMGVLALVARRADDLGPAEVELLTAFGGHASIAIERARDFAEAERRRHEAEILAGVASDLAECHDLDTVLARIARGANALCAADVTSLAVRDPDGSFPARHVVGARSEAYRRFRVVRAWASAVTPWSAADSGARRNVSPGPRCRPSMPKRSTPKASAAPWPSPSWWDRTSRGSSTSAAVRRGRSATPTRPC
jgi:GAF domain-containing protein